MDVCVYIALGSSLGDRERWLRFGIDGLRRAGVPPDRLSSVWETEPVDSPGSGWFLNMVVRAPAPPPLSPEALLDLLLEIEEQAGRVRARPNAPRTLDLDLLLAGDARIESARLVLPHPRMWTRRFVLEPLAEIAPDLRDPVSGRPVREILASLEDPARVRRRGPLGV